MLEGKKLHRRYFKMYYESDDESVAEWVAKMLELDEARFLANFHQTIEKDRQKAWHDRHIKKKNFCTR
jgi:hypothetical protein